MVPIPDRGLDRWRCFTIACRSQGSQCQSRDVSAGRFPDVQRVPDRNVRLHEANAQFSILTKMITVTGLMFSKYLKL